MGQVDFARGETPEMAMRAVLRNHPTFDEPHKIAYYSKEPDFMQVSLHRIPDFDWEQYNNDTPEYTPGGTPNVYTTELFDIEGTKTEKIRINNVWITTERTPDGELCHVKFAFLAELDTAYFESGELHDSEVNHSTVWQAERVSTEPVQNQ